MKLNFKIYNSLQTNVAAQNFFIFLFLFSICLLLYFNALNHAFLLDDDFLIVNNFYIKDMRYLGRIFKTDVFHFRPKEVASFNNYYRPLQIISYMFDYSIWRLNPLGYRLTNIFIHSLNGFLLFWIAYLLLKNRVVAFLASVFFCIHPIQVFLVTSIAGRSNLLETIFLFSSLIAFIYYLMLNKKLHYALSISFYIVALLSREGALLLPLFILISAMFLNVNKKKILIYLIPFVFISAIYVILRRIFMPFINLSLANLFSLERLSDFLWRINDYLGQLILPVGFQVSLFGGSLLLKFALVLFSAIILIYLLIKSFIYKNKTTTLALAFYFTGLLPIYALSGTIEYFGTVLSEHYVYIASAGFFLSVGYFVLRLYLRFRRLATICLIIMIFLYASLTILNNNNYRDELTFYKYVLNSDPDNNLIRINLGNIYLKKGTHAEAIRQAKLVLASEPSAWDAYLLLGNVFNNKGDLNKAEQFYKKTLSLNPVSCEAYNNLGLIYNLQGKQGRALEYFKRAADINPEAVWAWKNLANLLFEKRLFNKAVFAYSKALDLEPFYADGYIKMGIALAELGLNKESEEALKKALKLEPRSFDAVRNLGSLYANTGSLGKAVSLWQRALEINPDNEEVKKNIERARQILDNKK